MGKLSDQILLESYYKAVKLELNQSFIDLLLKEINQRNLDIN
jgi:hypothetical protein